MLAPALEGHRFIFPAEFLSKLPPDLNRVLDLQLRISTSVLQAKQKKKLSQLQALPKSSINPLPFKPCYDLFSHTTQKPDAPPALLLHL